MAGHESADTASVESVVYDRYANGAQVLDETLCCPVDYDPRYLEVIPQEVIDRDYGCGDPSKEVESGEVVLDLGSGTGKICFIAAQVVGASGNVIGVDMNDEMLAIAEAAKPEVASRIGFDNIEFRRGRIQDLRTSLTSIDNYLLNNPIRSAADLAQFEEFQAQQRVSSPLVADDSVDVVVSNCVLNLVKDGDKAKLFTEIFRVLRRGGRVVISDIVADEPVPEHLKKDPELWSGCVSGAFQEKAFLDAFATAGFYGIEILKRDDQPWRTAEGIEFRSMTVRAWKGKQGECREHNQAVIYKGPWSEVRDDDGHTLIRGVPMSVCEKTFQIYNRSPYDADIVPVEPLAPVDAATAGFFDCTRDQVRHPHETKGEGYRTTSAASDDCCEPGSCS